MYLLSLLAVWSVRTEPGKVRLTQRPPDVPPRALGAQPAEASVVVGALDAPVLRVVVQTLAAELALAELDEPHACRHRAQVPVVRVLAVVADLAQVTQVVLAHGRLLLAFSRMRRQRRLRLEVDRSRLRVTQRAVVLEDAAFWLQIHSTDLLIWRLARGQAVDARVLTGVELEVALLLEVVLNVQVHLMEVRPHKVGSGAEVLGRQRYRGHCECCASSEQGCVCDQSDIKIGEWVADRWSVAPSAAVLLYCVRLAGLFPVYHHLILLTNQLTHAVRRQWKWLYEYK